MVQKSSKWLEDLSKGRCHELEALALKGLRIVAAEKGFVSCTFTVSDQISDVDGKWQVGAMATLIDDVGATAIYSSVGHIRASLDFSISYVSTAKIHEEVVIEAKVVGNRERLTSVVVEVRRKADGELIALGKQWMASNNKAIRASKL